MAWTVAEEPRLRGYAVEWLEPGDVVLSRRNELFRTEALGAPVRALGSIPGPAWRRWASRLRPAQRLLRHFVYNVVKLDERSFFVTFDKSVGVLRDDRYEAIPGFVRPSRVVRGGAAVAPDGTVFFGEYLTNRARAPMHIYSWKPGAPRLEIAYEFPAGAIRHVHGIHHDPFTDALWCATGDFGDECRLLVTRDGFATVETFGSDDESWRCVTLLFTKEHVFYATDAEFDRNRIYRVERTSGERTVLGEIDGPVYYACARGSDLFFAVTAELCPSQVGRSASLWHVDEDARLDRLIAFEKDRWPVLLLLPGTLHLPLGPGLPDEFCFQGVGLRGADARTFRVRRS